MMLDFEDIEGTDQALVLLFVSFKFHLIHIFTWHREIKIPQMLVSWQKKKETG